MISILTTLFNREKYIAACIESVLHSTYSDWELIIVDDGSTDRSLEIAHYYSQHDPRIKVYRNETNLGDYFNRNKAASYAKGKYLKYLDADDLIYPHSLEIMVNAMEQFTKAALGISQYVHDDLDPYPFQLSPNEIYQREYLKRGVLDTGPSATIIRRDIFESLGGFSGKRYIGDVEFWLKIAQLYPIVKIQDGLIFWRRHEGQEHDLGHSTNAYLIMNYQMNAQYLSDKACPLSETERKIAVKKLNHRQGRNILSLALRRFKFRKANQVLINSGLPFVQLIKSIFPQ